MFVGHKEHELLITSFLYEPGAQGMQSLRPVPLKPASHGQFIPLIDVLFGTHQSSIAVAPRKLLNPAGHIVHVVAADAPENVLSGQALHSPENPNALVPVRIQYVPGGHASHLDRVSLTDCPHTCNSVIVM